MLAHGEAQAAAGADHFVVRWIAVRLAAVHAIDVSRRPMHRCAHLFRTHAGCGGDPAHAPDEGFGTAQVKARADRGGGQCLANGIFEFVLLPDVLRRDADLSAWFAWFAWFSGCAQHERARLRVAGQLRSECRLLAQRFSLRHQQMGCSRCIELQGGIARNAMRMIQRLIDMTCLARVDAARRGARVAGQVQKKCIACPMNEHAYSFVGALRTAC